MRTHSVENTMKVDGILPDYSMLKATSQGHFLCLSEISSSSSCSYSSSAQHKIINAMDGCFRGSIFLSAIEELLFPVALADPTLRTLLCMFI